MIVMINRRAKSSPPPPPNERVSCLTETTLETKDRKPLKARRLFLKFLLITPSAFLFKFKLQSPFQNSNVNLLLNEAYGDNQGGSWHSLAGAHCSPPQTRYEVVPQSGSSFTYCIRLNCVDAKVQTCGIMQFFSPGYDCSQLTGHFYSQAHWGAFNLGVVSGDGPDRSCPP